MSNDKPLSRQLKERLKHLKDQKKSNKPFKSFNFLTPEYKRSQEQRLKKLMSTVYERSDEKKLGNTYEKMVRKSFETDNPDQKFRLSHVDKLGLDYDVFFLYSKKDIGKTRQLGKKLVDIRAADPTAQVVFIRNTKEEAEGFRETMNSSPHGPTGTNGEYVGGKDELKRGSTQGVRPCGFFAYCTGVGFTKGQGGEFDNVKFGYGDECNSLEGGLTFEVFTRVNVFLSSFIRDKKGVVGYMMGNLLQRSNIFLHRLGVSSRTRLKVFEIREDLDPRKPVLSRLLYLNTGDLFKGIEKQEGLLTQFLTDEEHMELLHNRPGILSNKSEYEEIDLKQYRGGFSFVFKRNLEVVGGKMKKADFVLYAYRIPNSIRVVIGIEPFRPEAIRQKFRFVVSEDPLLSNAYPMIVPMEKEDFGECFIEVLDDYLKAGEIGFGGNGSQDIFEEEFPRWRSKYIKEDADSI